MGGVNPVSHFGIPVSKDDGSLVIYAEAHEDIAAYRPVAIIAARDTNDNNQDGDNDNTGYAKTRTPITLAVNHWKGAPQKAVASGEIGEFLVGGAGKMLVDNVTSALVGGTTFLKVLNTGEIGQGDGTTQTVDSIALACEDMDSATDAAINVQFLGVTAQV